MVQDLTREQISSSKGQLTLGLFVTAFLGLMTYISYHCFWADSEMWATVIVREILGAQRADYAFGMKPLFNLVLLVNYKIAESLGVHPMVVGRWIFALNAVWVAYLVMRIVELFSGARLWALFVVMLFVSSQLFLERGFRVRSDLLMSSFNLMALWLLLEVERAQIQKKWHKSILLAAFVLQLLALGMTPKSVYFLLASLPMYIYLLVRDHQLQAKEFAKWTLKVGLGVLVIIGGGLLLIPAWREGVFLSGRFFIKSFGVTDTGFSYWHLRRFVHVWTWFVKDYIWVIFLFVKVSTLGWLLLVGLQRRLFSIRFTANVGMCSWNYLQKNYFLGWRWEWYFGVIFLAFAVHPDRLPFFIVSLTPFFLIWTFSYSFLAQSFSNLMTQRRSFMVLVVILLVALWWRGLEKMADIRWLHSNSEQRDFSDQAEKYLKRFSPLKIYDPVGIVPFVDSFKWYLGPGQVDLNRQIIDFIETQKVDVIFKTQRLLWFPSRLNEILDTQYWDMGQGVYFRIFRIELATGQREITEAEIWQAAQAFFAESWNDRSQGAIRILSKTGQDVSDYMFWDEDKGVFQLPEEAAWLDVTPFGRFLPRVFTSMEDLYRFDVEL